MKILLVSPRRSFYTGESITAPHLGLLYLAAVLRENIFHDLNSVDVSVIDDQLLYLQGNENGLGDILKKYKPDVIGVQAVIAGLSPATQLLKTARQINSDILTVMGGTGATLFDDEIVQANAADVVVRGEGEFSFSVLIDEFSRGGRGNFSKVPGITYLNKKGQVKRNSPPPPIHPMDQLPLPARDLVDIQLYRRISRGRCGNLVLSRGCSKNCMYCYSRHQWGHGQRRFSIKRAVEEFRVLVENYGLDRLRIEDDDFMENREWVLGICSELQRLGINRKMEWEAKGRPEEMEPEVLKQMRKAGCFRILMGVETMNQEILNDMNRPISIELTENAIRNIHEAGIAIQGTIILGIPGETGSAIRRTMRWLEKQLVHSRDLMSPCFFLPIFPAAQQMKVGNREFKIEVHQRDYYTGHFPVTSSAACNIEELQAIYEEMTPDRRGQFPRVAHLATWEEVQGRIRNFPGKNQSKNISVQL